MEANVSSKKLEGEELEEYRRKFNPDQIFAEIGFSVRSWHDNLRISKDIIGLMKGMPPFLRLISVQVLPVGFFQYEVNVRLVQTEDLHNSEHLLAFYNRLHGYVGAWRIWKGQGSGED